jgi:glyoxylase-like metal-dependent hydrolase (beta-lactamase superfamily II)
MLVQIAVGRMKNFAYLVGDGTSGSAALIDPGFDVAKILSEASRRGLEVEFVFNTHSHRDHCAGNEEVKRMTGAKVVAHVSSPILKDIAVVDGSRIGIGKLEPLITHTPGHSKDSICILIEDKLFTGDTLFVGECGRTDVGGGDPAEMYDSLFKRILSLPDEIEVYPGHDYGERPHSTIGHERRTNYTLKPRSKGEFMDFMSEP